MKSQGNRPRQADNLRMPLLACCRSTFKTLSRAAAKCAAAKLRDAGALRADVDWLRRVEICERCPVRVLHCGVSYCGKPLLQQIDRDPTQGCGCPVRAKAQSPAEHCPLTRSLAASDSTICNCKWCAAT